MLIIKVSNILGKALAHLGQTILKNISYIIGINVPENTMSLEDS
jgi:hypothetical protein